MKKINEVICLFAWDGKNWEMVESFPTDHGGSPAITPKNVSSDRHAANEWVRTPDSEDEDENFIEGDDIMNHVVMTWDFERGVKLARYTPPKWEDHYGNDIEAVVRDKWKQYLPKSFQLEQKTSEEARKWLKAELTEELNLVKVS